MTAASHQIQSAPVDLATVIARLDEAAFSASPTEQLPPVAIAIVSEVLGSATAVLLEKRDVNAWAIVEARAVPRRLEDSLRAPMPLDEIRARLRREIAQPEWDEITLEDDPTRESMLIVGWSGDATSRRAFPALATSLRLAWTRIAWSREADRRAAGRILVGLGQSVAAGLDIPTLYRRAIETAISVAGAHQAWIFIVGEGSETGLELRETGRNPVFPVSIDRDRAAREAAELALKTHRRRTAVSEVGDWVFAAVPITTHKPCGALVISREPEYGRPPAHFATWDLLRLNACANYLASAQQTTEMLKEQTRSVRELVLLNDVARDCASLGLDRLMPAVCERICRSLPVDASGLFFADPERQELVWGGGFLIHAPLPVLRLRLPVAVPSLATRVFLTRHAAKCGLEDIVMPEMQRLLGENRLQYIGGIPLCLKDRAIGVLLVARREPIPDEHMRLLDAIGAEIAVALENSLLYAEATRRADDLLAVQEIGEVMARSLDSAQIVREAGMRLCRVLDSDAISIYARRSWGFEALWRHGIVPPRPEGVPVPESDPSIARALSTTEPIDVPSTALDNPDNPLVSGTGMGRVAVAPLLGVQQRDGRQIVGHTGAILIGRRSTRPYTAAELRILGTVAAQLAVAIDNAELYQQTRQRADDLALVAEAARALQEGAPPKGALAPVVEYLARHMRTEASAIVLVDPASRQLELAARSERVEAEALPLTPDEFVARAIRERTPQARERPWALALPMSSGEQCIGAVILCESTQARSLSAIERDRARAIGDQVAAALDRAELQSRLRKSLRDLDQAQAQLVRRERLAALGELAALVAHEVRNPLGVIINSLGTLDKVTPLDGDARRIHEIMIQESGRLDRIVSDMLDYTRPTVLRLAPGNLAQVLRDAVQSATSSERSRGTPVDVIRVTVQAGEPLPPVPMDDRMLHQAFVNLLSNAFQSVPREGGRVDVEVGVSEDGTAAQMVIEDNGQGMTPEVRQRLFEPFFTTKAKGSGLGLAMVKRIVDGHGGEILVETEPGAGTRFVLKLPLKRSEGGAA